MSKLTIDDLFQAKKEGRQFVEIRTSDLNEAIACAEAGVEIIMCMRKICPSFDRQSRCLHHFGQLAGSTAHCQPGAGHSRRI